MALFLIDSVVKVSILLAVAGVVTTLLRRSSAASRHLVWTVALLAALALPALSGSLPRWRVPMITLAPSSGTVAALGDDVSSRQMAARLFERLGNTASATAPAAEIARAPMTTASVSWSTVGIVVWLGGTALLLGRLLLGLIAVNVLSRRTRSAVDARWLPLARRLAEDVGASNVTFRRSPRGSMPMACGLFRASVTLPEDADAWPDERLRVVLLHELAHVKRRDCLTHVLAQVACALYWFNPLSWVAARHARAERERACDDLVLAAGTPGADYADQLLEIARVMRAGRLSSVVAGVSLAMAHRSQLEGRLMAILDPSVPRASVSRARCVAIAGCAAITLLPLASLQAWGQTSQPKPSTAAPQPAPAPAPVVMQGVVDGVRGGVRGDVRGSIQGGIRGGVEGGVRGGVRGGVQAAMQSAVQGAVQGTLQGTVQGTVQGAIQGVTQSRPVIVDEQKATAQESKGKADPKVVAALTAALKDSDKEVREAALHALVQLRDPGLFEPLTQALKDGSADVREQAAFGLGQIRDKRAVDPLIAAIKDPADNVREQVVFALGQLRDPRATEALTSALKDSHANVREQAAFALGQFRATSAVPALVVALKDSAANVREQAAFALGQIRDPRAIDALTEALKDASADVRQQAAFALGQLAR
jgi:beta-lactamase regulating signal transducer with metallopeptidase domain